MKILFLQDNFTLQGSGGGTISTYELATGLHKAGHEVFVITTCRKKSEAGESEHNGLKIFKIASDYPSRWRAYVSIYNRPVVRGVEELLRKIQPDVVNANNIHSYLSYACLKLAKRHSQVVIFTARDVMTFNFAKLTTERYLRDLDAHTTWRDHVRQAGKRWNPFRNFLIKRYLRYADKIVAISEALRDALHQNGINGDIEVIYNGIDVTAWNITPEVAAHFREKYDLQHKKVLLFGGRLSPAKGSEKAIEALAQIVKDVPDTVLLVAGTIDAYAQVMKEYAKELHVDDRLIFTGWIEREEIKAAYAAADIVLMPSICFDAFGRVNVEAMAAKKPVIGTRYGGTPEIVSDGVTGYIVDPLYPEQIAEKALDLLKNPERAAAFGNAGYERAVAEFSLQDKVEQYISLYETLLGKGNI